MAELKLYHYKARAYHPALGRFLQTDPIGYGDGLNLYQYAGSDPVNARDPSGLRVACTSVDGGARSCTVIPESPRSTFQFYITPPRFDPRRNENEFNFPEFPFDFGFEFRPTDECAALQTLADALARDLSNIATALDRLGFDPANYSLILSSDLSLGLGFGGISSAGAYFGLDGTYGIINSIGLGAVIDASAGFSATLINATGEGLNGVALAINIGTTIFDYQSVLGRIEHGGALQGRGGGVSVGLPVGVAVAPELSDVVACQ